MVCQFLLYNKVNQLYVYIYPHISSLLHLPPSPTLPIPPLQVVTKHRADLPVLCGCFPLAFYFTFGSIYKSMPLSLHPSLPLPCPMSSSPVSTSASLLLSCPQVLQNPFFFEIPYMCFSIQYLFFSYLLHSVGQTLGPSTSLQINQFRFILWLSNIPLHICATSSLFIHLSMDTQVASMSWLL